FQRNAFGQRAVLLAKSVQIPRDLPRVATQLREIALELVDLFDNVDGDDDVVVFELEECARVVEQDVGVEDVVLAQPGLPGLPGAYLRPRRDRERIRRGCGLPAWPDTAPCR